MALAPRLITLIARLITLAPLYDGPLAGRFSIATAAFTPASSRPEDVSVAIRRLVTFVEEQSAGDTAPDVQQALIELRSAGEVVEAKWRESRASLIEAQTSAQETRDAAVEFHRSLVILRRVLVTVHGRRHLDYQTLRYTRVSQDEESIEVLDDTSTADTGNPAPAEGDRDSGAFATVKAEAS